MAMWRKELWRWTALVFFLLIARHVPDIIESVYSRGLYRIVRTIDLFFLRWIPFSVGDLLYLLLPVWLVRRAISIKQLAGRRAMLLYLSGWARRIILWFYVLWGLNYFRQPLAHQWHWTIRPPDREALLRLTAREIDSVNYWHRQINGNATKSAVIIPYSFERMSRTAANIYRQNASLHPELDQRYYVLKPSLWGQIVSYMGVSGYINPYTHESQVNTRYPQVFRPHIMLHELAHQIGYAYEDEAEFIAFWEAMHGEDPFFRYSAHLSVVPYLLSYWKQIDSTQYQAFRDSLLPGVRQAYKQAAAFARRYRAPVDLSVMYDRFLRVNQQGRGLESYGRMILYLHTWYRQQDQASRTAVKHIKNRQEDKQKHRLNEETAHVEQKSISARMIKPDGQ